MLYMNHARNLQKSWQDIRFQILYTSQESC